MIKSLSQLLDEATTTQANFPPARGVCHAIICLNRDDKSASADDHIECIGFCRSRQFIWSEIDQCRICRACWTPEKNGPIIYVDEIRTHETPLPYKRWCHMATDGDINSLHVMAAKLGLKREWFQDKRKYSHYDLTPTKRAQALKLGAIAVSSRILLERCWPEMKLERRTF